MYGLLGLETALRFAQKCFSSELKNVFPLSLKLYINTNLLYVPNMVIVQREVLICYSNTRT